MKNLFKIVPTQTFNKNLDKLTKSTPQLKKKVLNIIEKIKANPFQGRRVENLGYWRIWVGEDHRMFYEIIKNEIVLLELKKKDKHTYRS